MKDRLKLFIKMLPLAIFLAAGLTFAPSTLIVDDVEAFRSPECVYGSERSRIWGCHGSTSNLCEGSSDCPTNPIQE